MNCITTGAVCGFITRWPGSSAPLEGQRRSVAAGLLLAFQRAIALSICDWRDCERGTPAQRRRYRDLAPTRPYRKLAGALRGDGRQMRDALRDRAWQGNPSRPGNLAACGNVARATCLHDGGGRFIKASTGKESVNATLLSVCMNYARSADLFTSVRGYQDRNKTCGRYQGQRRAGLSGA